MAVNNASLIIEALKKRNLEDLEALLDARKEDVNVVCNNGQTPLQCAVCLQFEQGVNLLLARGANINVRDDRKQTPLHNSCFFRSKDMVTLLLEKGANLNYIDENRFTPLHVAVIMNFIEGVELLLSKGAKWDTYDKGGNTPLHYATENGTLQMVEMLVNNGVELELKNNSDETPLHVAARYTRRAILRLLLLEGADVNAQEETESTPLHLVFQHSERLGDRENNVVEDLLDWGASLIIRDEIRRTVLHLIDRESSPVVGFNNHIIKLQFVDLKLAYKINYMCSANPVEDDRKKCTEELAKLKTTRFGNQSVLDVFSKYKDPTFVFNGKMREAIYYSSQFEKEFPVYVVLLRAMFKHAEKRVPLLNTAQGVLIYGRLPHEITRKIMSYLPNEDIVIVIDALNRN
uniref:F-box domain-containing protein n=2 Tax=Homalodisca liturata TaxID=320908 RepID=A0A1B6J3X1_9HEMI